MSTQAGSTALAGVKILDLTQYEAGTSCTQALAWLGADVVKVEWPEPALGGSTGRVVRNVPGMGSMPPNVQPSMNSDGHFNDMHAHKRSVTINTRTPRGLELVKQILATADVVVKSTFRTDPVNGVPIEPRAVIAQWAGDRVTVEMTPYDLDKGRLVYRHKDERSMPRPSSAPPRQFRRR